MLKAMQCEEVFISPDKRGYESAYADAVKNIRSRLLGNAAEKIV